MKLIISLLIIISSTASLADHLDYDRDEENYGSGFAEASGELELPGEFFQMDMEDHEVNSLETDESGVTLTDMKDVVGAEFLISRRFDETDVGDDKEEEGGSCNCDCYEQLKYQHDQKENTREIDFVLQDQTKPTTVCPEEKYLQCCRDFRSQARFRFPSSDPILPDIGVSESVHLPLPPSSPPPPPAQTTAEMKTGLEWDVVTSLTLGNQSEELAELVPSMAHWLIHFDLSAPARISLKLSSRSPVGLLVKQNVRPRLKQFDLIAVLEGTMSVKLLDLRSGRWFLRLSNEESSQQEMLLTISAQASPQPALACCSPGGAAGGGGGGGGGGGECHHGVEHVSLGCLCRPGWYGAACDLSLAECSSQLCNSRGHCSSDSQPGGPGVLCVCQAGYGGSHCQTLQCPEHCGDNGVCQAGTCRCFSGWGGPTCNTTSTSSIDTMETIETIETVCPESFLQAQGKKTPC